MKRFNVLVSVLVASILYSVSAIASSGTGYGKIKSLLWYEGHAGVLVVQENMSDLGGCGRADYYILDDQHPYFKEIYATVLSAHLIEQPLTFVVQDCAQGISRISNVLSSK